jgi:hypothetical protein
MTKEQQRIAIAEACGFTKEEPWLDGRDCWSHKDSPMHVGFEEVPDFLNDLNAMHEAEGSVIFADSSLAEEYGMRLGKTYHPRWFIDVTGSQLAAMCHATAAQRAEAFLRTLNLWQE